MTTKESVHRQRDMELIENTELIAGFYQPGTF